MASSLSLSGILLYAFQLCFAGSALIELPASPDRGILLSHPQCIIKYNPVTLQPDWAAYRLSAKEVLSENADRTNTFRPDPALAGRRPSASDSDYTRSGYDRGHLAPAADMKASMGSMIASFFLSNISPQDPSLNRGLWSRLEEAVRKEAVRCGAVYVTSGPIFYTDRITREKIFIGKNRIPVPDAFFKVLLVKTEGETRAIAFIVPNGSTGTDYFRYALSVDEAERITGLNFFRYLPDELEESIESSVDSSTWFIR